MTDAPTDVGTRISQGYAFGGSALELGSVVLDGAAYPQARIRIPLGKRRR
ncbi:MAG: hypothetical protein QOE71_1352 [Pseudonocardiales bacterium]|jgi:hypothetical protein|nr:hypothetical protein [Pseudonocardiales bacterium]